GVLLGPLSTEKIVLTKSLPSTSNRPAMMFSFKTYEFVKPLN
ncbi:MAG: hypothetical protein ACI9K1_002092, partial [Arcticibacterium sp.]